MYYLHINYFYMGKVSLFIFKLVSPPYSPDLNPIERVWNEMKNFVRSQLCKTPEEVAYSIEKFRQTLTPLKCQNYINKTHEVIEK